MGETTVGQRVYLVRLAHGDGVRKPMPMREFAELLSADGDPFYASRLSDIENDKSTPSLDEVDRIAAVDPLTRGRDWLGWGDEDDDEGEGNVEPTAPVPVVTPPKTGPTPARVIEKLPFHRDQAPSKQPVKRRPGRRASAVG